MERSLSVILERPGSLAVREITVPEIPGDIERVSLGAAGICGSDVRYYQGENPWALHTLGRNVPSPPNMVLGHEVAGTAERDGEKARVAILAYRGCGKCEYCRTGRENLCDDMEHFGHSAGWKEMEYFPGGMAHRFTIWRGFAYEIPDSISFEEATFLDGLAVALHALDRGSMTEGMNVGIVGFGPIGMLAAQAARAQGAHLIAGCDTTPYPVELAKGLGFEHVIHGDVKTLEKHAASAGLGELDLVIDTVGTEESINRGLALTGKSGTLVLIAVHEEAVPMLPVRLSGERSVTTSANNRYDDFPRAIRMLSDGKVEVKPLISHRFPIADVQQAFDLMLRKDTERVYKVVLTP